MITEERCNVCDGTGRPPLKWSFRAYTACPACFGAGRVLRQQEAPAPAVERHQCVVRTECCCDPHGTEPASYCPEHGDGTDRPRCSCGRFAPYLTKGEKSG